MLQRLRRAARLFAAGLRHPLTLLVFYFGMLWAFEWTFRAWEIPDFRGPGLWVSFVFCIPAALLLWILSTSLPRRANRVIAWVLVLGIAVLFGSQMVYHRIFYTYYTVYSAANGGQVLEFINEILFTMRRNWVQLLTLLIPLILWIPLQTVLCFDRRPPVRQGLGLVMVGCLHVLCRLMLPIFGTQDFSPWDLYYQTVSIDYSMEQLGVVNTMRIDLWRLVTGFEPEYEVEAPPPIPEALAPDEMPDKPKEDDTTTEPESDREKYGVNALDLDFEALAAAESDETIANMHRYFGSLEPSSKNEKTGLFAGCNLIWITAEGFSQYAIDKELTPTLYKLANEGFRFTNWYTPLWGVSTSDGEYVALTGLYPKSGVWSLYQSSDNAMPFTAGNQLRSLGYSCRAYHNHTYTYYSRDKSHPNLGYDYKGVGNGLEITEQWPESDLEMIDVTTDEYVRDEPFHTYYMTVSGHLLYDFMSNSIADKNRELVEDLPYSEGPRAYLACSIELDRALELLLERLEQAGVLDNTVIVLSADHYPYGLSLEELSELAGHDVDPDFELYRNACIIYKKGMESETIDEPCSSIDLLPTVSNLMGWDFDSRLLMGRDIFSDAKPLVILSNRSFITDKARYNTKTGELEPTTDEPLPEGYEEYYSALVSNKMAYSTLILDKDYYATLGLDQ